jgi:NAD(P)-dependent dehydrogenase (short-subunit alcohol dehydrogenase family)
VQSAHGGCDILINNAGTGSNETIMEAPDDKWQHYFDRFASPEEVANFFVFLCSDRASYSVGATYDVDGGMLKVVG